MILVVGATGTIGSELVKILRAGDVQIMTLVRDPGKAALLQQLGVRTATGDLTKPETLDVALDGVDKIFLVIPPSPQMAQVEGNLLIAAQKAQVKHLVKISVSGASPSSDESLARWHGQADEKIKESNIPYTFLKPTMFMQNLLAFKETITRQGAIYQPVSSTAEFNAVDARDIAEVGAKILSGSGYEGKSYVITGPENLTYEKICAKLSAILGKPVRYIEITQEEFKNQVLQRGAPEWLADALLELYTSVNRREVAATTNVIAEITGKQPRKLEQFIKDYASQLSGPVTAGV